MGNQQVYLKKENLKKGKIGSLSGNEIIIGVWLR